MRNTVRTAHRTRAAVEWVPQLDPAGAPGGLQAAWTTSVGRRTRIAKRAMSCTAFVRNHELHRRLAHMQALVSAAMKVPDGP